jgi:predicted DNA-binding transcriptional regulator AlpA
MAQKPDDLVGLAEVAAMLNITRTQARNWTRRPDFPEPLARLRATPVWRADDVKAWAKQRNPQPLNLSSGIAGMLARSGDRRRAARRKR